MNDETQHYDEVEFVIKTISAKMFAVGFCAVALVGVFFALNDVLSCKYVTSTFYGTLSIIFMLISYFYNNKYKDLLYFYSRSIKRTEQY